MSARTVAILATLDTKGEEVGYLREQIEALGGQALLIDMGVIGEPGIAPDISKEKVSAAGGTPLTELLANPTRQAASPVMVSGAISILTSLLSDDAIHAVVSLGGTQGTSNGTAVMQALPYGFPKLMVSTVASGDTSAFVGIKDIVMMPSVGDILGLNPLLRKVLANAAAAAWGMACSPVTLDTGPGANTTGLPVVGMTNLGTLTDGAMEALRLFREAGHEVIVFHAVGAGGLAMEQMMKDGLIGAVFDYALGEITDELFDGLRAATPERLTVAGALGLPAVYCPGGAEHVGLLVEPNKVPDRWADHCYVFHNPIICAPRLDADEMASVAREIGKRLSQSTTPAVFLMPMRGTSRYGIAGGPLNDPDGDAAFLAALRDALPSHVELIEVDAAAEDPAFVREAVTQLRQLIAAAD